MAFSVRNAVLLLLLLLLLGSASSHGRDWKLQEYTRTDGTPALVKKVAERVGKRATLHLIKFNTRAYTLKVVDQGANQEKPKFLNLRDAMEKSGCVAGINGGFFGTDFKALGVVYEDGKQIAPYARSSRNGLTSGVIWSGMGGIHIVRRQDFKGGSGVRQAIQTGPMLISNGAAVKGLSNSKSRPRSFVLTDWKGTWMIGTSSFLTLAELADILNSPEVFKDFKVNRAINLDGGRSTGFYLKEENGKVTYRPEMSRVRNFLGIVPK